MSKTNKGLAFFLRSLSLRDRARTKATIYLRLEISDYAFRQKMDGRTPFTILEKEKIAEITGKTVEFLFELDINAASMPELSRR